MSSAPSTAPVAASTPPNMTVQPPIDTQGAAPSHTFAHQSPAPHMQYVPYQQPGMMPSQVPPQHVIVVYPQVQGPEPLEKRWPRFWQMFAISLMVGIFLSPWLATCFLWVASRSRAKAAGVYGGSGLAMVLWGIAFLIIASVVKTNGSEVTTCNRFTGICTVSYDSSSAVLTFLYAIGVLHLILGVLMTAAAFFKMRNMTKVNATQNMGGAPVAPPQVNQTRF